MQHVAKARGQLSSTLLRSSRHRSTRAISSPLRFYSSSASLPSVQTSFLSNKIEVRTLSRPTSLNLHALALVVRAGPRFEDDSTDGFSYLVEQSISQATSLALPSSPSTPLRTLLLPNLEYQTLHLLHTPSTLPSALLHLSSLLQAPLDLSSSALPDEESATGNNLAGEYIMDDLLHAVAYGGRGLGRRSVPAPERVEELLEQGEEQVEKWRSDWWVAERMVLVGVGAELEHGEFVKQAEKVLAWVRKKEVVMEEKTKGPSEGFFGSLVASLLPSPSPLLAASSYEELSSTPSSYVGGKICLDEGGDAEWLEGGTQVMLAFEGLSEGDEDLMALEVIATLLGGRKTFQPGGPGTGMRSRLYLNLLHRNPSVLAAKAFNLSYSDLGLFGITLLLSSGTTPSLIASAFTRVVEQLRLLTLPPSDHASLPPPSISSSRRRKFQSLPSPMPSAGSVSLEELERAKNRTLVAWLMERESGVGTACLDDLAFSRPSPHVITTAITSITLADIQRVAKRILWSGKDATVVAMGPGATEGLSGAEKVLERALATSSEDNPLQMLEPEKEKRESGRKPLKRGRDGTR